MIRSYTDHAANERTFLAWIRTGLAIMALGFVMERLDLLVTNLRLAAQGREVAAMGQAGIHGLSVGLVALGMGLIAAAICRFVDINRAIEDQAVHPSRPRSCRSAWPPCCLRSASGLLLYLLHLI
jgi:putative membrane protein